jgi:iron(III) transport system permease protein
MSTSAQAPARQALRTRALRRAGALSPFHLVSILVAVVLGALALYPLLRIIFGLFVTSSGITIAPLRDAVSVPRFWSLIIDTAIAVVGSSALAMILGAVLAWLNERTDARIGSLTDSLPLIPFLLPPIAGAVGWVLLLSPHAGYVNWTIRAVAGHLGLHIADGPLNIYSWYGIIFAYMLYQVPYAFLLISNGLRNTDPYLDEQSHVCGSGVRGTLWRITLPSVRQSLGAAWLLMMLQGFSLYSIPVIIGPGAHIDILSVRIIELMTVAYPPQTGAAVGLSLIIVFFVGLTWLWQLRLLKRGRHAQLAGKGQRVTRIRLGRWRWAGRCALLSYGVVAVILPLLALVLVSLNGFWTTSIRWASLGLAAFQQTIFDDPLTVTSLKNSLWIGVAGATIGMIFAALAALFVQRARSRMAGFVDGAIKLPSVFPHLVIAVGFILAFTGAPFRIGGTTLILLMAYVSIYVPLGSVAADAAVSQIGKELPEASSVAGARAGRTFRRIYLPLLLPGLMAGWAFLFARMVGDLTATALLSGPTNIVVGFRILQVFSNGSFADLASLAVALTLMSSIVVIGVHLFVRHREKWRNSTPAAPPPSG